MPNQFIPELTLALRKYYPTYSEDQCRNMAEVYYHYIEEYPEWEEKQAQHREKFTRQTGYTYPVSTARHPDHDYASSKTGIDKNIVLYVQRAYNNTLTHQEQNHVDRDNSTGVRTPEHPV